MAIMNNNDISNFCHKYRVLKLDTTYKNTIMDTFVIHSPPAITSKVELEFESLEQIVHNDERAQEIVDRDLVEKELREKYPAVQKAYDEYQLLIKLTQEEKA